MRLTLKILILTGLASFVACDNERFRSNGNGIRAKTQTVSISCDPMTNRSFMNAEISGIGATQVVVRGEFCAKNIQAPAVDDTHIMFIIDTSGSMTGPFNNKPAADPQINGSCGRLDAGNAIVEKLQDQIGGVVGDNQVRAGVKIAAVRFSSNATDIIPLTDLPASGKIRQMNLNTFCAGSGGTNYQAAFRRASDALESVSGPKKVFFISDGEPTEPSNASNLGSSAAQDMYVANPGLDMNVIYLNPAQDTSSAQRTYLLSLVNNDESKLKFASDAGELAGIIQTFQLPEPPSITGNKRSVLGTLSAPGFDPRQFQVEFVASDAADQGAVWRFESVKFPLFGRKGQFVMNDFTVRAQTTDGQKPEAVAKINFKRQ